jgi:uncharacterized protein (DUF2132 family)
MAEQPNNPLHGQTLKSIVEDLESEFGWDHMGYLVNINCFKNSPTLNSSLKFLRKTPWARVKVENLWIERIHQLSKDK